MPRLSKDLTKTRDDLVRQIVFRDPTDSLADINDILKMQTGHRMASYRLAALRKKIVAEIANGAKS